MRAAGMVARFMDMPFAKSEPVPPAAPAPAAAGRPVPAKAAELMAKTPVPFIPFSLWRWLYVHFGTKGFDELAAKNGVSKERMLDQPYKA